MLNLRIVFIGLLLAVATTSNAALVCSNNEFSEHAIWHVGEDPNVFNQIDITPADSILCEATEAELSYIQKHFTNLPNRIGTLIIFYTGKDAIFIIENL